MPAENVFLQQVIKNETDSLEIDLPEIPGAKVQPHRIRIGCLIATGSTLSR